MAENGMLSASDVAMLQNGGHHDNMDANNFIWIFGIILIMMMFGGGWNNNSNNYVPQYATQQDVQSTAQYSNLLDGNRDILTAVHDGANRAVQATDQAKYEAISVAKDLQGVVMNQIGDVKVGQSQLMANQNECCMNTRLGIAELGEKLGSKLDQNKFDLAMNAAAINANTTKEIQSIKDMFYQNKLEERDAKINSLEMDNKLAGVIRYPNMWAFNAGCFPSCFNCQNG